VKSFRVKGLAALAVAVVGIGTYFLLNREPRAQGHSLTYWLRAGVSPDESKHEQAQVEAAIREIGAAGAPVLLSKLRMADPMWKAPVADWAFKKFSLALPFHSAGQDWWEAQYGFSVLRTQAVSAVPELAQMLFQTNDSARAIAASLAYLGSEGRLVLKSALTNADEEIRMAVVSATHTSPELIRELLPEFTAQLSSPNWSVACYAAMRMASVLPPEELVPLVAPLPRMGRGSVPSAAISAWAGNKDDLKPATNQLVPLLESTNANARQFATNALKILHPATAFAHGIDTNRYRSVSRRHSGSGL
jgi:hypothetical protein